MAKRGKKSGRPREIQRSGALCLAFANTGVPRRDDRRRDRKAPPSMALASYPEVVTWVQRMDFLDRAVGERLRRAAAERPRDAAAVCADAAALRAATVRIFTAVALGKEPRPEDLALINGHLRLRWATRTAEGFDWDWPGDEGDLERPLWLIAQSAVDLLISDDLANVDQCVAKGCFQLFVRRSPRRRWCDMRTCGNRQKGRRHHQYLRSVAESRRRRQRLGLGLGPPDPDSEPE